MKLFLCKVSLLEVLYAGNYGIWFLFSTLRDLGPPKNPLRKLGLRSRSAVHTQWPSWMQGGFSEVGEATHLVSRSSGQMPGTEGLSWVRAGLCLIVLSILTYVDSLTLCQGLLKYFIFSLFL